jgi:hypothetical protein
MRREWLFLAPFFSDILSIGGDAPGFRFFGRSSVVLALPFVLFFGDGFHLSFILIFELFVVSL